MYDKIFKPKKIKLITGEVVEEKVSRTWLTWLIIILLIAFSVILTNFDFKPIYKSKRSVIPDYYENKRVCILKQWNDELTKMN